MTILIFNKQILEGMVVRNSVQSDKDDDEMSKEERELESLLRTRFDNIRKKIIDKSRRNPLISTRLNSSSISYIRVVDELPNFLLSRIQKNKLCFSSLPALGAELPDEQTYEFQTALSIARASDEKYLHSIEEVDSRDEPPDQDELNDIENALIDRVRIKFGLEPRQVKGNISLKKHASNHKINPDYNLPMPDE